jgi:hypothetical protein
MIRTFQNSLFIIFFTHFAKDSLSKRQTDFFNFSSGLFKDRFINKIISRHREKKNLYFVSLPQRLSTHEKISP